MTKLDPEQIKVVNWSRKRKRNKKLWNPNPRRWGKAGSGRPAGADPIQAAEAIRKAMGG